MKKIFAYIFSGIASATLLMSCDSILNKSPLDSFADSNFWTSADNVEAYANTFFNEFLGYGNGGGAGAFYFPTLNDNQCSDQFRDWNYGNSLVTNSNWTDGYEEIRRANVMINRVEKMSVLDDTQKAHWTGVAKLMRALEYYWLVRLFGDVPIIDTELKTTDDLLYGKRIDRDEVMDFVLEDLNAAVSGILANSTKTSWSKNLAYAIKSEICLFEGTYCKYRVAADGQKAPDASRAQKFLNEAKSASKAIMDQSYTLAADYKSIYTSLDLAGNSEVFFYKHYVKDIFAHSTVDYTCSSTIQNGMSKDAFDSYLFIDGKPKAVTSENNSDAAVMGEDGLPTIEALLAVRDPRLGMQIDSKLGYTSNEGFKRYSDRSDGMMMTSTSGYTVCKFDTKDLVSGYRDQAGRNYTDAPLYWLSVIYLNYAEACAELGSCTKADLDASVNKLRSRVGMPAMELSPVADPDNDMGVSSLIWEIRRERRVELMFDNDFRFWDLYRWHQLEKLDGTKNPDIMAGANVSCDTNINTEKNPVKNGYIDTSYKGIRKYESKFYHYPVPTGQILLNPELSQNPGWPQK